MGHKRDPVPLPFHLTGAWIEDVVFQFETIAALPKGSTLALLAPDWIGDGLKPANRNVTFHRDHKTDLTCTRRARIPLPASGSHVLGEIKLPARTAAACHLLAHVPQELHDRPYDVVFRQLYRGREVGRVTWKLVPVKMARQPEA
jgi:hypothetical protein